MYKEIVLKEITLKAILDNVEVVTDSINSDLECAGCPIKVMMQIDVAIDEIFSNIVNYGYDSKDEEVTIEYDLDLKTKLISITFIDRGKKYNPLAKEDPNVNANSNERAIGGLGIYIVKKTMDDVTYKYEENKNYLTIIKKF